MTVSRSTRPAFGADPGGLRGKIALSAQMIRRDLATRYRGSLLGMVWSVLTPLTMLGVYAFVFGVIFPTRHWSEAGTSTTFQPSFVLLIFVGQIIFTLFSDVVSRAPRLVVSNRNYVKKIVFPLEILPVVSLGSALSQAGISTAILLAAQLTMTGSIPWTILLLPLAAIPFLLFLLGISWFLASLGTYVRDIAQMTTPMIGALLFLSPIFYPLSALPDGARTIAAFNPLAIPIEETRNVLLWGRTPDWIALGFYTVVALVVAALGLYWFETTRKGFADVL